MKMMYRVLWIDDEKTEELQEEAAIIYKIDLEQVFCYEEGIDCLKDHAAEFDAVILDVYCKTKPNDARNYDSFRDNLKKVDELCNNKEHFVPWFVYTGGPSGTEKGYEYINDLIESHKRIWDDKNYYQKPKERVELFNRIKIEADKRLDTQIRLKYDMVFKVDDFIEEEKDKIGNSLLEVIRSIEEDKYNDDSVLRDVSTIYERIRSMLVKIGFLPEELNNGITFTNSAAFLGSRQVRDKKLVPQYIQQNIYTGVCVGYEGGHNLPAKDDVKNGRAIYLVKSVVYSLLSFLYWLSNEDKSEEAISKRKKIMQDIYKEWKLHSNIDNHISRYEDKISEVEVDDEGNVHCEKCLIHKNAERLKGTKVKLSKVKSNTSATKSMYPYYAQYEAVDEK